MTGGEKLRTLRKAMPGKPTQGELGKMAGLSQSAVSAYEVGDRPLTAEARVALAPHLGVEPNDLLDDIDSASIVLDSALDGFQFPVSEAPEELAYIGEVPAGSWAEPVETSGFVVVSPMFVPGPERERSKRFVATVTGMSCYPLLRPKMRVVFHADPNPNYGVLVLAVRNEDNYCTLKELTWSEKDQRPVLVAPNPEAEPIEPEDQWRIIARVVGVISAKPKFELCEQEEGDGLRRRDFPIFPP